MKETLDISLYLSLNYTDYHPQYKIYLDGQEINLGTALSRPRIPFEKKFSIEVESGKHTITFDAVNNESSITLFNIVINKFKCNTNNLMLKNCRLFQHREKLIQLKMFLVYYTNPEGLNLNSNLRLRIGRWNNYEKNRLRRAYFIFTMLIT